jgi:hypothetical protein
MIYLYSMAIFALVGAGIAKFKVKWPWLWLVLAPVIGCASLFILGELIFPPTKPITEATFSILMPLFFIPPNLLAVILGYLVAAVFFDKSDE